MTRAEGRVFDEAVAGATVAAFRKAELELPDDVLLALTRARAHETDPVAQSELDNILENIAVARRLNVPLCQDTGVPVVYLTLPPHIPLSRGIVRAVEEGVRRATDEIPLRPNVVDPCSRKNSGDNTGQGMPAVHVSPGDRFTITVLPKGAGSENVSRSAMLLPGDRDAIERFVVETMLLAGGKPCPPVILGVGIGSTFDGVAALAKKALLLPLEPATAYEQALTGAVNALRIGPMGRGGDTTALAVKVMKAACHTASLPVAVNVQCWAARHATVEVEIP
jgi:fumarate hydratase subunit alpha